MKHLAALTLLFSPSLLHSQPVWTSTDASVAPGVNFVRHISAALPPGAAGANVTWDFATLTTSGDLITTYDPALTPEGSNFPAATIATTYFNTGIAYYSINSALYEFNGFSFTGPQNMVLTDVQTVAEFPIAYLSNWADNFSGGGSFLGGMTRTGNVSTTCDAHGQLIMPYGTVNNVLRLHGIESWTDTPTGGSPTDYVNDFYYWITPGLSQPVLVVRTTETFQAGTLVDSVEEAVWLDGSEVMGVMDVSATSGFSIVPNPATTNAQLTFTGKASQIEVNDATGRLIDRIGIAGSQDRTCALNVSGFPSGLYVVSVIDPQGVRLSRRLVVE